nr:hypothetical protein [Tanacetum cinerariifolium]
MFENSEISSLTPFLVMEVVEMEMGLYPLDFLAVAASIDADEGITLVDVETDEEEVAMDAESQGRMNVNAASKGISVVIAHELVSTAEPIVFDDEDITMTMA